MPKGMDWPLVFPPEDSRVFRTVQACSFWDRILRAAWDHAEPGVLFVDRINRLNNLWSREDLTATNPCGEIPLPATHCCTVEREAD